ncbi:hypothetical protein ACLBPJ_30425, partial [Klebsiella pneumoniae]
MAMYEVGTVTGAASQARVTGATTKWSQVALAIMLYVCSLSYSI